MAKPPQTGKGKGGRSRGLGRGLSALMSDISPATEKTIERKTQARNVDQSEAPKPAAHNAEEAVTPAPKDRSSAASSSAGATYLPISHISPNPDQPRRFFDKDKLAELTESIRDKGVLQPILVRPIPLSKGQTAQRYQIVAGERRWQASQKAGLESMPALIRDLSDQEVLEIGVVENVQRADLNPLEEAQAYQALVDQFGRKQSDIANAVGKSRAHIANMMRLLTLPLRAQDYLKEGKLSTGHARAIIAADDPNALADLIVQKGLSVRAAEDIVRAGKRGIAARKVLKEKPADIRAVEKDLTETLGLKVNLNHKNPNGELRIAYRSLDQLDAIIDKLKRV